MFPFCVLVSLGINKPLSVAAISNLAEALGVVVPIPVCAKICPDSNKLINKSSFCIMLNNTQVSNKLKSKL
jgi:hypothetical protein